MRAGFILAFSGGPIAARYALRAVKFQIDHAGVFVNLRRPGIGDTDAIASASPS
jgi:hypothetical protein